jgi:hypothetical protein
MSDHGSPPGQPKAQHPAVQSTRSVYAVHRGNTLKLQPQAQGQATTPLPQRSQISDWGPSHWTYSNVLLAPLSLIFLALAWIVNCSLCSRHVYILAVQHFGRCANPEQHQAADVPRRRTIAVLHTIENAKAAVLNVLQLPEYRGRIVRFGYTVSDEEDFGLDAGYGNLQGMGHGLLVLAEQIAVR